MIDDFAKAHLHSELREVRAAVLWKLDGLGEFEIRRPLTPTGTNLLGLVKHLAVMEARYFGEVFDRLFPEPLPRWDDPGEPDADLWASEHETREEITARYRRACEHADATITALAVDSPGHVPWWPGPDVKLFNVLVHMLTETSRHAGHADILREQLDGSTGTAARRAAPQYDAALREARRAQIERAAEAAAEAAATAAATATRSADPPPHQPSGVWATAVGVARVRALETERENPLFRDPLAKAFAAAGGLWPSSPAPADEAARLRRLAVSFSIVIRTKFLDDLLQDAAASGVRQVVLLGAGMDSRAFRTDWPEGTRLFEVDTAEPLAFKTSVLRQERALPRCERITVAADLRDDWPAALAAAGHDPAAPTVWIAEGLLIYLPEDAVELLLNRISALSAVGSRLGLTLGSRGVLERFATDAVPGSAASLWVSEMPDDPVAWLAAHGWEADAHTLRERAAAYGRPISTRPQREEQPGGLISAVRR